MVEATLDDCCTCQQALLQASKSLVLDLNSGFFLERLRSLVEAQFLENGEEEVVLDVLCCVVFEVLFTLLHLVSCFRVDGLLEDAAEDLLGVGGVAQLVDGLFGLVSRLYLKRHVDLLADDLRDAEVLQVVILSLDLLQIS